MRNNIAALDAATGAATPWNPNANSYVKALAVSGATLYAGGQFTAIGELPQSDVAAITTATTGVPDLPGGPPLTLRLEIESNPVHAATGIAFGLRADEHVTLELFDLSGRRVAQLLRNQAETAGWHALEFRPSGLPGGLYLIRLQAGCETVSKKALLLP